MVPFEREEQSIVHKGSVYGMLCSAGGMHTG